MFKISVFKFKEICEKHNLSISDTGTTVLANSKEDSGWEIFINKCDRGVFGEMNDFFLYFGVM